MNIIQRLWHFEPAVVGWVLDGGLAAAIAFIFHTTNTQTAAITTIAAAVATVITAVKARPVEVGILVGAVATVATAAGAFGLHLTAAQIGAGTAILSGLLALLLRQNLTPKVLNR